MTEIVLARFPSRTRRIMPGMCEKTKGVVYTGIHRILMSIHGIYGLDSIYLGIHAVYRASRQRVYKNK